MTSRALLERTLRLSFLRGVRAGLPFIRMPLIGYVYLRPRSLGVRVLWGRITRSLASGAGIEKVATDPEQRA